MRPIRARLSAQQPIRARHSAQRPIRARHSAQRQIRTPRRSAALSEEGRVLAGVRDSGRVPGSGETPRVDSDRLQATNRAAVVSVIWPIKTTGSDPTANQTACLGTATPQNHHLSVNGVENLQLKNMYLNDRIIVILLSCVY